jgi:hypothetical protein
LRPGAAPIGNLKGVNDTYYGIVYGSDFEGPAYIKDLDPIQLSNELLAAVLGRAASLPMPTPYLVAVTADALGMTKGPKLHDGSASLAFATSASSFSQLARVDQMIALGAIKKWSQLGRAACFDEWIANSDRHAGNLLFQADSQFLLIDHSHAFTGPAWAVADLQSNYTITNRLLEEWPGAAELSEPLRQAIANMAPELANEFVSIDVSVAVTAAHIAQILEEVRHRALVDFLSARCEHVAHAVPRKVGFPRML